MDFNPWKHIRLMGAICCIVSYFIGNTVLVLIGLGLIGIGMVSGLQRMEDLFEEKFGEKEKE